jgi:hypothetical protein
MAFNAQQWVGPGFTAAETTAVHRSIAAPQRDGRLGPPVAGTDENIRRRRSVAKNLVLVCRGEYCALCPDLRVEVDRGWQQLCIGDDVGVKHVHEDPVAPLLGIEHQHQSGLDVLDDVAGSDVDGHGWRSRAGAELAFHAGQPGVG